MKETDNIENMIEMWNKLDEKINRIAEENKRLAKEIKKSKYKSSQDKLVSRYRRFIILELIWLVLFPGIICLNPLVMPEYKLATVIYFALFFALEAIMDYYLMTKVQNIDIFNSSVREISDRARQYRKIHLICVAIGIPLGIGAVLLFILSMGANQDVIYGMIGGAVVGLLIGAYQLIQFLSSYKNLQDDVS